MKVLLLAFAIIGIVFGNYDANNRKSLVPWSHAVNDYYQGEARVMMIGGLTLEDTTRTPLTISTQPAPTISGSRRPSCSTPCLPLHCMWGKLTEENY